MNGKKDDALSAFHTALEARLASLETNAFTFVAVVVSVAIGLGHIYLKGPTLFQVYFASLAAKLILAFGILYIQATAHAFRSVQIVMSKIESNSELQLRSVVPAAWNPKEIVLNRGFWWRMPEMLKMQFGLYLCLLFGTFVAETFWIGRHNGSDLPIRDASWLPAIRASELALLAIFFFVFSIQISRLWNKQVNLLLQLKLMNKEEVRKPTRSWNVDALKSWIQRPDTLLLVLANLILAWYAWKSDSRNEQVFLAERRPYIDVSPVSLVQDSGTNSLVTLSLANYSGFDALNVGIDVKYGELANRYWTGEWQKASQNELARGKDGPSGVLKLHEYTSQPPVAIPFLPKRGGLATWVSANAMDLEEDVCSRGNEGFPVFVRITWQNDARHLCHIQPVSATVS